MTIPKNGPLTAAEWRELVASWVDLGVAECSFRGRLLTAAGAHTLSASPWNLRLWQRASGIFSPM